MPAFIGSCCNQILLRTDSIGTLPPDKQLGSGAQTCAALSAGAGTSAPAPAAANLAPAAAAAVSMDRPASCPSEGLAASSTSPAGCCCCCAASSLSRAAPPTLCAGDAPRRSGCLDCAVRGCWNTGLKRCKRSARGRGSAAAAEGAAAAAAGAALLLVGRC